MYCFYFQNSKIGLPLEEFEQGIIVGTEPAGQGEVGDDLVEHAAKRGTVDRGRLDGEADNTARILVHDDKDPVGLEND